MALSSVKTAAASEFATGGVFIFIGLLLNADLICRLVPANRGGQIDTDLDMQTAISGLFAIADVRAHS